MHTSLWSQILAGTRDLTLEQACSLSSYFGLNDLEEEFFLGLVQLERAGTHQLKTILERQLENTKKKSLDFKSRLPKSKQVSDLNKEVYYSRWYYVAIWLMTDIPEHSYPEQIAEKLTLDVCTVREALSFLVRIGLCSENDGKYSTQTQRTHIEKSSPLAVQHHINWRLKALEKFDKLSEQETVFTAPLSLSVSGIEKVQKLIRELVDRTNKIVSADEPEALFCLNIDWIKLS